MMWRYSRLRYFWERIRFALGLWNSWKWWLKFDKGEGGNAYYIGLGLAWEVAGTLWGEEERRSDIRWQNFLNQKEAKQ